MTAKLKFCLSRDEWFWSTKQRMARPHNKEGGNHLEHENNIHKTMEHIDGGLHLALDGQNLGEKWKGEIIVGWRGNAWLEHNSSHRFIHYSHGSKVFCYVLYLNGFHGKKSEKNKFPPPPKKANYQSLQPANQQNNLSMRTSVLR